MYEYFETTSKRADEVCQKEGSKNSGGLGGPGTPHNPLTNDKVAGSARLPHVDAGGPDPRTPHSARRRP